MAHTALCHLAAIFGAFVNSVNYSVYIGTHVSFQPNMAQNSFNQLYHTSGQKAKMVENSFALAVKSNAALYLCMQVTYRNQIWQGECAVA